MKLLKLLCITTACLTIFSHSLFSQVFWTEAFQNGCASGCLASGYTGPNGTWAITNTGGNGAQANTWYVSGAECGHSAGMCGTDCGTTDPSLHVGSTFFMVDPGAAYLDGAGFFNAFTDRRADSPTINCTGKSNITLDFNYIERGFGLTDNATLWYYDGATWSQLVDLPKTTVTCAGGQGLWTNYNMLLPASANNNANVKIGFRWINNDDGNANDPSFAVDDITLSVPASVNPPIASFSVSATTICENDCVNFTDQSTSFDVGGITAWNWNFGDGNSSVLQNPANCYSTAGVYTVSLTVSDINGTDDTVMTNLITVYSNPSVDLGSDQTLCADAAPVTLDAGAGYTYLWTGGSTNQTLDVSTTGAYSVTITNGNSCTASDLVNITVDPNPTVNLGPDLIVCSDDTPYTLDAGPGYTYLWTGGSTNQTLDVSTSGTYAVTITDGNSCTDSDQITITIKANPTVDLGNDTTLCSGGVPLVLNAGNGFNYLWTGGSTNQTLSVFVTGTYSVTITDAIGCTGTDQIDVTVNSSLTVDLGPDQNICTDNTPVTLDAGTGYTYLWTGGSTNQTLDVSSTGTYGVTITDGSGCTGTDQVDFIVNTNPAVDIGPDQTICGDAAPVTLDAGGGFTYLWTGGSTNQTLDVSSTGTYSVTVTDGNSCTATDNTDITVNINPPVDLGPDQLVCTGAVPVTLDAGGGFTYLWTGGSTNQTLDVSISGTYSVTITDGNSCTAEDAVDITVYTSPPLDLGVDQTVCTNATPVTLDAGSGYTYLWNGGTTDQTLDVSTSGIFSVTITDANSCTAEDNVNITVNTNPAVDLGPDQTVCSDAAPVTLDAGAGYTYLWTGGTSNQTLDITTTGLYSVTITDGNSCTASDDVNITVNLTPPLDLGPDQSICTDATPVTLDAGSGYSYLWNGGSTNQTLDVSTSGTYSVTITDGNSCTAEDTIDIAVYANPTVDLGPDQTVCSDAAPVTLDAGAGYTYLWTGGSTNQTLDVITTGTYSVTISDGNSCTASDDVDITVNVNPVVNLGNDTTICSGSGSLTLDAGSGFTYLWSDASTNQTLDISISGNYSVTITDGSGCTGTDQITVTFSSALTVDLGSDQTICADAAPVSLDAGSGYTYLWTGGSTNQTLDVSVSGTYSVTITDLSGCTGSDQVDITVNINPVVDLGPDSSVCSDVTPITLDAGSGNTYLWSDATTNQTIDVSASGNYSVTVTDGNSCTGTDDINITVYANPTVDLGPDTTACSNSLPVTLDAGAGFTYLWTGGYTNQTLDVNLSGTYAVTISDANSCSATDDININVYASPSPAILGDTTFCSGVNTSLDAGAAYSIYIWSTSDTTQAIDVFSAGLYSVTVTDINGCTGTDNVYVSMEVTPSVNVTDNINICKGGSVSITGSSVSNYSYIQWYSDGSGTFSDLSVLNPEYFPSQTDMDNGGVNLILTAYSACGPATDTIQIVFYDQPEISAGADTTINSGAGITLEATGGISYIWTPGDYLSCTECSGPVSTPEAGITYTVIGFDINNCTDTASITISIDASQNIYIPNAFSPNGDGQNDILYVRGKGIKTLTFIIYDRWGEKIYETGTTETGWDGTYRGKELDPGVYVYYVIADFYDDTRYENQGNITLVR